MKSTASFLLTLWLLIVTAIRWAAERAPDPAQKGQSELGQEAAIGQAIAFGEAQPAIVALIAPAHAGVSPAAVAAAVAPANTRLPAYARVACYHVMSEPFTVANGMLTGNGPPRREQIRNRFAGTIDHLHEEITDVVS